MISRFGIVVCLCTVLSACSYRITNTTQSRNIALNPSFGVDSNLISYLKPYSDSISVKMNILIGKADTNFLASGPNSNLFNWCADALFTHEKRKFDSKEPVFCLLNGGGLRSGINKGPITIGDIYKLMPFDNNVVWVRLPISKIPVIEAFLASSSGVPIANAKYTNGKLNINGLTPSDTHFWIFTTDYLASGGDKMSFFQKETEIKSSNFKLRDVFINEVMLQKTIVENKEIRFIP